MPCEGEEVPDDHVGNVKKMCLKLQSQDRRVRKQTYIDLKDYISSKDLNNQELRLIFTEAHMYILNGLRDKTELVREQTIIFLNYFIIEKLPLNDFYLTYVLPVIVERIGSVELIEESEEIRLQLLQFLNAIISKYSNTNQLKPFLNDCIIILAETVKDKYPAIKELSCTTIISLAKALPTDFHLQAESLIKPVLTCFVHQRYKVRLESINAIGEIIMHSSYKGLDEVVGPLAERLFDQMPPIRRAVARIAARWLLEYRDRYSFFYKILPLLLTGLNDEIEETRAEALELWEKVGRQYQHENEKDLKDQLDYLYDTPKNYPVNMTRPNLGCRVLVQRNVSKLSGAISRELSSWQEDVRLRCSQLLCVLALHAEEGVTQNLQDLLPAIYSAARDHDPRVVVNIAQACEIIGLFVRFDTWSKLIFPVIEDNPHYGHLTALAGLIKGSTSESIDGGIVEISKILADDSVCCNRKEKYQLQLLSCVRNLAEKCGNGADEETAYHLFKIVVTLLSLRHPDINEEIIVASFEDIAGTFDRYTLWKLHTEQLLKHINVNPKMWTIVSDNACIFLTILGNSREAFGENLENIQIILNELFDSETDVELKLKTLYILANVFEEKDVFLKNAVNLASFLTKMLTGIFVPSLVWHAGATAEAIRTMAALCLRNVLISNHEIDLFDSDLLREVMDELLLLLISLLEDASYRSRQLAVECLILLKQICCEKKIWSSEDLVKIYPEILKRFDDPIEKVRVFALKNVSFLFDDAPEDFKQNHYRAHHELIIDTLLIHLDDDEPDIQRIVCDILKAFASINKIDLLKKIEKGKSLLRNQEGCEEVVEFCTNLSI